MRYVLRMLTQTDTALVRLYYENFGLSEKEIAGSLGLSPVVVASMVKENNLVAPAEKKIADDKRKALTEQDLDKALTLVPFYARTEVTILNKLYEVVMSTDANDPGSAAQISMCARALKDLKAANASAKLDTVDGQQGITVQIMNQL